VGQAAPGQDYVHATILAVTSAVTFTKGVAGGSGAARDTEFLGAYIMLNATAATLTVAGFGTQAGAAANWLISGLTTSDQKFNFETPLLNEQGPLILTASAANLIVVFTRAYTGP
jgi:hypothetical protein